KAMPDSNTAMAPNKAMSDDIAMMRVEGQIQFYEKKSRSSMRWFKVLKTLTIIFSALIPVLTGAIAAHLSSPIAGGLGALVAVIEGLQHLNQFHDNWVQYRGSCETLTREKCLYLTHSGPYAGAANPRTLFVERCEEAIAQENSKWSATRDSS